MKRTITGFPLAALAALFFVGSAPAQITYGTLDNFDVINDTGVECHGFEIELEGLSSTDVVYTFGAPNQRYGDPTLVPTTSGVIIRYASAYDSNTHVWSATTPFSGPPYLATQGHSCWFGAVVDPNQYLSCGCDHFGASLNVTPTKTSYRWLVETSPGSGTLSPFGTNIAMPAPVWNVTPQPPPSPGVPPPPPIVQAAILPPAPDAYDFGDALWVKVFTTELPDPLDAQDLDRMVLEDPGNLVPNDPAEVEIEWMLLQASVENENEQLFGGEAGAGAEAVSRRFEFYKYVGDYDPGTHEALCDNQAVCPEAVGDIIGAQNVAVNLGGAVAPPNTPPVANAGPDQQVYVTDTVTLDGSASSDADGNALTYAWTLTSVPAGSSASLSDATAVKPSFAVDKPGTYIASLVVNDGTVDSPADEVVISTLNSVPIADAGMNMYLHVTDTAPLDGSASYDVDGDPLTYQWTMTGRPAGSAATLSSTTAAKPTFVADKPGTYNLSLTVNDGKVDSIADIVWVATMNSPPVANAGPDQTVIIGNTVLLDGTASSDVDGDTLSYSWVFTLRPAHSRATLTGANTATPRFKADKYGHYHVQLIVNDGTVNSPMDQVDISAMKNKKK